MSQEPVLQLPDRLQGKLESYRKRVWIVKVLEGVFAALFGLLLSFLVVYALDRFIDTPGWARLLIFAVGIAGFGLFLPLKLHRWIWQRRSLQQVAKLLRGRFPRLGDQLLGIVELAREQEEEGLHSKQLVSAAMSQVDTAVGDEDFSDAVPEPRHFRWAALAALVLALAVAAFVMTSDAAKNALARWIFPTGDTERYTFAQLDHPEKAIIVPLGEEHSVEIGLLGASPMKPERATAQFDDRVAVTSARDEDDRYLFPLQPRSEPGTLRIKVGDARHEMQVQPEPRPELSALGATIELPDYLQYSHDLEVSARGGALSVLKGSTATLKGEASRNLAAADADGEALRIDGATLHAEPEIIEVAMKKTIGWTDVLGLEPREPITLAIEAIEDEAPEVIAEKLSKEHVVLEGETLVFDLRVEDDFGVKKVGLAWEGIEDKRYNPVPAKGSKVVFSGEPEERLVELIQREDSKEGLPSSATFQARREGVTPQTLKIRAFAEDYLPGRERSYSPHFIVHVLSAENHAMWITDQFSKWFKLAQEIEEREIELHETNKALRDLDPSEIDSPANRARLEAQAQSEKANARRLQMHAGAGKEIVEQATKNDEFDAERLESMATMMQKLDQLARNRMPSVADLLKEAADAPSGQGQQGEPGSPSEPSEAGESKPGEPGESKPGKPGEKGSGEGGGEPGKTKDVAMPDSPEKGGGAPQVGNKADNESKPGDPKEGVDRPAPSLTDQMKGYLDKPEEDPDADKPEPGAGGKGALGLPTTQLQADPNAPPAACPPAQEKTTEAVNEQKKILEEFAAISEQFKELLGNLEASTFVKRLKAASERQMVIARDINSALNAGFGLPEDEVEQAHRSKGAVIAGKEKNESETIQIVLEDLQAYFHRKQETKYKSLIEQMKDTKIVRELAIIGDTVEVNLSGRSMVSAEFWADTMDRWAEELVSAASGGT